MEYYIQGNAAKAEQIKAAFEKLGYDTTGWEFNVESGFYYTTERKRINIACSNFLINLIKTHPDYKELELTSNPKFKVGDWVVSPNGSQYLIAYIDKEDNRYLFEIDEYTGEQMNYEDVQVVDGQYHLWTIADAKDGDVLVTTKIRSCPFIYRKTSYNNQLAYYYAGIDGNGIFCEGCIKRTIYHFGSDSDVAPATKEQRDLLFAKMKEAGYTWDAEKKELKKIQPHYDIANFQAGMPVLVRDCDEHKWLYTIFGIYNKDNSLYPFVVVNMRGYEQCIPFNEKTKHLLGTTDMPSEEYINW